MHCRLVNCVMQLLYGSIVVFPFTLSVTAFSYSDFDAFPKRTSIYKTFNSTTHDERNWDGNFHSIHERFPKNLSDVHFHSSYHMKGFLRLLTTGLKEPIEVWYNKEHRNSRIDFYNGDVKTYHIGELGLTVKIIPKYDSIKKKHYVGCWRKTTGDKGKIKALTILPSDWHWPFRGTLKKFEYVGDENVEGHLCRKWQYERNVLGRNNVYIFWVMISVPPVPVRYQMYGYDTLLTSYYDKYIIDYVLYEKWPYEKRIFDIPKSEDNCVDLSKNESNSESGDGFFNPMADFLSPYHDEEIVDKNFEVFQRTHKKYYDHKERRRRKYIFKHNLRFINSMNRMRLTYKLQTNAFADMTIDEYNRHKGDLPDSPEDLKAINGKSVFYIDEKYKPYKNAPNIPKQLDWRKYGAVSSPRGQGTCGCCWAFAAIGAIESANFIKTGEMVRLSEQQMVDCTWKVRGVWNNSGNHGCHGGMAWKVFFWGRSNTIATSDSYGSYKGQEGYCKTDNITAGANIYGFRRVKKHSGESLRRAIAYHGPAAVAINSRPLTFKFYSHGIYDDKHCNKWTDHAVLVVGYNQENGINYWLVKNSWSTMWGDEGYVKIKEDACGILQKPVVVLNKHVRLYPWYNRSKWKNTLINGRRK